jgi:hypothetical protein
MKRLVFAAVYFGLIAFLGGALAERHGYFDSITEAASAETSEPARLVHYRAVLAAGDASIPNFDNAVETLAHRLDRADAETTMLTSDGSLVTSRRWQATAQVIGDFLRDVPESDGCLVFVTSHGNEIGLVMGMDNAEGYYLTPTRLAAILARDCGKRPTVAILSGCHTGTFLTAPMMTENRIILTAARRDRTSFGCSTDTEFTYFDECLLEAMGHSGTWRAIFERTKACVEKKERGKDFKASYPQAFFGAAVQDLGIE